jgi:hypothetical protein
MTELQKPHAELVAARLSPVHHSRKHKVIENAMGCRGVQTARLGELLQRYWLRLFRQRIEQGHHAFDDLDRQPGRLNGRGEQRPAVGPGHSGGPRFFRG